MCFVLYKKSPQSLLSCNYHLHLYGALTYIIFIPSQFVTVFLSKAFSPKRSSSAQCWLSRFDLTCVQFSSVQFVWVFVHLFVARVLYHFLNLNCYQKFHLAFEICCVTDFWWWWWVRFVFEFMHPSIFVGAVIPRHLFSVLLSSVCSLFWSLFMPRNDTKWALCGCEDIRCI